MSDPRPRRACVRLAGELQTLRDRTGLSLAALAAKTAYSKSTWARYLSGRTLPPWSAAQTLAVLASEPEARLRALWELAEEEWSGRGVVDRGAASGAGGANAGASGGAARAAPGSTGPTAARGTRASAADASGPAGVKAASVKAAGPKATGAAAAEVKAAVPESATGIAFIPTARSSSPDAPAAPARPTPPSVTSAPSAATASTASAPATAKPTTATAPEPPTPARRTRRRLPHLPTVLVAAIGIASLCLVAFGIGSAFAHRTRDMPAAVPGSAVWGPIGCSGGACSGRDPIEMNCGVDPQSLAAFTASTGASLEVRYKGPCQSAWVRAWSTQVGDVLTVVAEDGATQSTKITDPYGAQSYSYTPMVPAEKSGMQVKACLTTPGGKTECVSATVP